MRGPARGEQPLYWVGSAKRDLLAFPEAVKDGIGTALSIAQFWRETPRGEAVERERAPECWRLWRITTETPYRAVYTVRFRWAVYVLHCFQKKSHRGIRTPKPDVELVLQRLRLARQDHENRYGKSKRET